MTLIDPHDLSLLDVPSLERGAGGPAAPAAPAAFRIAVLSTSPRAGLSLAACTHVAGRLRAAGCTVAEFDARRLPLVAAGTEDIEALPPEIRSVQREVLAADAVVLGAPVHRSAPAGASRNLVELLRDALRRKPVLPLLAAGSVRAHLVGVAFRADLLLNFDAEALPAAFISEDAAADEVERRLDAGACALLGRCRVGAGARR